ncbi:KxYKxGKxW signal peptide domain-containing protein [Levilactobacillus lindianensis]|uniref:KxYKxGKxW signal peptide domain-containing protein n=1 Tax=Levilactobacillus lindianensis TaxID=2486018 RepID=UPI000F74709C|nr:KxYKxGKxW signal peptide domain-containing protein [Levilactobacillus lindianensis]
MRKQINVETKEHFKSYKAGKNWVFACITVATLGLGMTGMSVTANADTTPATPKVEATDESDSTSEQSNQTSLKTTTETKETTPENDTKTKIESKTEPTKKDVTNQPKEDSDTTKSETPTSITETPEVKKNVQNTPKVPVTQPDDVNGKTTPIEKTTEDAVQPIQSFSSVLPTSQLSRSALLKTTTLPDIMGVDATEWMPDPAMRAWAIKSAEFFNKGTYISSSNLFLYVSSISSLSDNDYNGDLPTDFTGIQYLTNLTGFSLSKKAIAPDHMIDFSFAPKLTTLTLTVPEGTPMPAQDASTFMQKYLGQNTNLKYLYIRKYNLTGNLPDLSAYTQLINVNLDSNALTGSLTDLGNMPSVLYLQFGSNKLSGAFPDLSPFPKLESLYITDNDFSGKLPDLSSYTNLDTVMIDGNHFTTNFNDDNLLGAWTSHQTVQGGTYKLSELPKLATFDPLTNVVFGSQDIAGNIDTTAKYTTINEDSLPLYFWRNPDPDNPLGFVYKANGTPIPARTYTITVVTTNNFEAETDVTFTIVDDVTPVDPDPDPTTDPGKTDPTDPTTDPNTTDPTDPTTNPDTTDPTDPTTDPNTTEPTTDPGSTTPTNPVTPTTPITDGDGVPGDQVVTGGDGDQIVEPTVPTTDKGNHVVSITVGDKAKGVKTTGHKTMTSTIVKTHGQAAHVATTKLAATKLAATKTNHQSETTLPQTGEQQNTVSAIVAGVAVALSTLGLGLSRKRHE